jgi:signal transduction histidine kinase
MKIPTVGHSKQLGILKLFALFAVFTGGILPLAAAPHETLTNAAAVLALSVNQATSNIPVSVIGVVTAAEPGWFGKFFVQDASGGVFVDSRTNVQPVPGDLVHVWGISHPGGYAPDITKPHWKKLGTAPLPEAKLVSSERLMSGAEDSQRVEVSGIARTAELSGDPRGSRIGIELVSGGYRFRAFFPPSPQLDPYSLVGAKVTVRGTAAAAFNRDLRHILTVTLFAPQPKDVIVEIPAPSRPFDEPPVSLKSIAQYRKDPPPGYQVHVKGVVTYQRKGDVLFLQDENGGLQVKSTMTNAVVPGDVVEAVGFPAVENFLPVLEDAVYRKTAEPRAILEPTNPPLAALQKGLHHADFVLLRGRLLDRLVRGIGSGVNGPGTQTTLILQASNTVFAAEKETSEPNEMLTAIPIGSLVEVRGICLLDSSGDGTIKSFRILLPTSHDVQVLEKPGWLTPQHLLMTLASVLAVLLVAIGWTIWVSNKNSILKSLVQEKEAAQWELQKAHDQLEERVRERTAQLKVEMTARKESELQFRAVLTERTRLAQELHDTLEQTLTGIALQQDLVASQLARNPDHASHHLKLARNLMRQSQADLHRSVWGLRSRADEEFYLANALFTSVRQITGDTGVRVETETIGEGRPLSEVTEENLLRIAQEAVTNALKHAGANKVKVSLHFSPQHVVLQISDDGKGFDPENCTGPKDGHFGLLGIRERSDRLDGRVEITSAPGAGTTVRAEIPIPSPNGAESSASHPAHGTPAAADTPRRIELQPGDPRSPND